MTTRGIAGKLSEGTFLSAEDKQVLIGEGLARFLNLQVGDEIILYGQGYRGQTAAGLYPIKGILDFPMPQLDNQLVYMPLALAQTLYSTEQQVTAWVLHTRTLSALPQTVAELSADYDGQANVRDWQDLSPEMAQQILMDKAGGIIMMYLLYGVVGFGLFATLLMMTLERQREFGVMLATGLLRKKLLALISIESLFIALFGVVLGLGGISAPFLIWFYYNPIVLTGETAEMILEMGWGSGLTDPAGTVVVYQSDNDRIGSVATLLDLPDVACLSAGFGQCIKRRRTCWLNWLGAIYGAINYEPASCSVPWYSA